jgi:hypothetical protein
VRRRLLLALVSSTVRAHPWRSALLAGAVAVLLITAAALIPSPAPRGEANGAAAGLERRTGSESSAADGQQAFPRPGEAAAGGEASDPQASSAPGVGVGDGGGELAPVAVRQPVRCPLRGSPSGAPLPPPDEQDGRRWVTVERLAGNCDAGSAAFTLLGIDTRLAWRSDADSFAVFVVDGTRGREATAGFADGQCAGRCSESQAIVPVAGRYTLEVQAGDGPWEVEIQEYRRP